MPQSLLRAARRVLAVLAVLTGLVSCFQLASSQVVQLIPYPRIGILIPMAVVLGVLLLALLERRREKYVPCRPVRVAVGVQGVGDGPRPPGWGPDDENDDGPCGAWNALGHGGPVGRPGR